MGTIRSTDNSSFKLQADNGTSIVNLYQKITANESSREALLAERDAILAELGAFARPQLALAV